MPRRRPRSPLLRALQVAPPADRPLTRRRFLQAGAGLALGAGLAVADRPRRDGPRVAIVGAGLAGLVAAEALGRAGLVPTLYEAGMRLGGRAWTVSGRLGPGRLSELGGEFIDGSHAVMRGLVRRCGLTLFDHHAGAERRLGEVLYAGGQRRSQAELAAALAPVAGRLQRDAAAIDASDVSFAALDRLSISGYLERLGLDGWARRLLEAAYAGEFGLDAGDQSAINLLYMIDVSDRRRVALYGDSDERFRVVGGVSGLVDALAARLRGPRVRGWRLIGLAAAGTGYRLTFAVGGRQASVEARADAVLLCLPFSVLRTVQLDVPLPARKRRAIAELGYGSGGKLLLGVHRRVWRTAGESGNLQSDLAIPSGWDGTRGQPGAGGALTLFCGGAAGAGLGRGRLDARAAASLASLERVWPGISAAHDGRRARVAWRDLPLARGSYACYRPGQWSTIAGAEATPVGRLWFAGEHCSAEHQGYLEGAADSGRRTAAAVAAALVR